MTRVPVFQSAMLRADTRGGVLPRRRPGRAFVLSLVAHVGLGVWLFGAALTDFGPVPPPPLTIQFFAAPPAPPRLVPLREEHTPPPPPAPRPRPEPASIPPIAVREPEPPAPLPIHVEPDPLPIKIAEAAPEVHIHDTAPDAPAGPALEPVGPRAALKAGAGEEPELAFLVPGKDHPRGPGGGVAGRDSLPAAPPGDPTNGIRRGGPGGGGAPEASLGSEGAFTGTGLASYLGRKYGVTLLDANRLGARTNDGARYSMLVPALSEAYHSIRFRGRRQGITGDAVESVQADGQAIAIRYRDGTVHVLVPTADGLVALYVSAQVAAAGGGGSKVHEAERALLALQRLSHEGARG